MSRSAAARALARATRVVFIVLVCVASTRVDAQNDVRTTDQREIDDYHYVFSSDCQPYMTWQARALYDSWVKIGSPGRLTRILSCTEEEYAAYAHDDVVPETTHAPSYVWYAKERYGDEDGYAAYNLPGGMNYWAQNVGTDRRWVVKLDADMILLKPMTVTEIPARKGQTAAGIYGYLVGVDNGMAKWFVDEETERRLARVGGWEIFDADDFKRMTPNWLEQTVKVRMDKRVWYPYKGTGDVYITEDAPRPWISEMYGFIFGCGISGLTHNVMPSTQLYAGYTPWDEASEDPFIVHYGTKLDDGKGYKWDKHYDEGHVERMTCETKNVKPFPVVPLPREPGKGASVKERREYIKLKIMYITVTSINESVKKYNEDRCDPVVRRAMPDKAPSRAPTVELTRKRKHVSDKTPMKSVNARLESEKSASEALREMRLLEKELVHESRMRQLWTYAVLSWIIGSVLIGYRVCSKRRVRSQRREKNPFRVPV